jgi:hypothetical protein
MPPRRTGHGASFFVARVARVPVDRFLLVELLRFGRAFLIQERREDHVQEHLEKLRFPVLHRGFEEVGGLHVFHDRDLGAAVPALVVVVFHLSEQGLAEHEAHEKKAQPDDGQAVFTEETAFLDLPRSHALPLRVSGERSAAASKIHARCH